MPNSLYIACIPLLPLVSFALLGLFGTRVFKNLSGLLATVLLVVSTILAIWVAYNYFFHFGQANGIYQRIIAGQVTWLRFSSELSIDMGLMLDPISCMMIVVVSFISLMVHIYSLSYMKGEERYPTYYAFLSLFTFSMLGLVLSSNMFQIYIFWELVGVSSYLLIGYYYDRPGAVKASQKAFIVTRFADLGFLIGILVLSFYSNTLDFNTLIERLTNPASPGLKTALASSFLGISAITWGSVLVFMGGAGKSAMFPLHIWLPDAMEGPTPVSALIHAATMVVAGVYLVARLFPVFSISAPASLDLVTFVGVLSALLAALIACTQTDIKRVLAYSTMSQIGFMMFSLGVARHGHEEQLGYSASMFHLFTHAFFKALLFLCAGIIIHLVHSNEMNDMGGIRKNLPVTHICFLIACLAISGIPPFAGFFSKEEILQASWQRNKVVFWIALTTSGITAFYMFRLYFKIFWHKPLGHQASHADTAEGDTMIRLPLVILAIGSLLTGFIPFGRFVSADGTPVHTDLNLIFSVGPVLVGLAGIFLARWLYLNKNDAPEKIKNGTRALYTAAYHKFYIDEIYVFITRRIIFNLVGKPAAWFDRNVVDGLVNTTGNTTQIVSKKIKGLQSGKVQEYAIYFLLGAGGLALLFIYGWK
ncbi:MAG: NADH-quinone oxidoreductase subunit L [Bacteroidetes bacterium]|nr:MAG: NADH-quinone oxidoreductase subunit L [Bacteroidota bacterium]